MGESLLLITIITLVVLTIRRGKPVILDNPLIIHRPGKYHITLAPQLNRAQNFIEQIVKQLTENTPNQADSASQFFAVHDEKVCAPGEKLYLLAVAARGGILYFQAINPQPLIYDSDSHLKTVMAFSSAVLAQQSAGSNTDAQREMVLHDAVQAAAQMMQIKVEKLLPA